MVIFSKAWLITPLGEFIGSSYIHPIVPEQLTIKSPLVTANLFSSLYLSGEI